MSAEPKESAEPRTKAGKARTSWRHSIVAAIPRHDDPDPDFTELDAAIRAIEDQAATEARAEAIQGQLDDIADIIAAKVTEARRDLGIERFEVRVAPDSGAGREGLREATAELVAVLDLMNATRNEQPNTALDARFFQALEDVRAALGAGSTDEVRRLRAIEAAVLALDLTPGHAITSRPDLDRLRETLGAGSTDEPDEASWALMERLIATRLGICGMVSESGPNGEPLACAYPPNPPGQPMHEHSWSTLPTFTAGSTDEVEGLDVERLVRAMEDVFPGWLEEAPGTAEAQAEMRSYAEQLDVAYRRLADSASPPAALGAGREGLTAFVLRRTEDVSGVSGTGDVAEGVVFSDGTTVLRWLRAGGSTAVYDSLERMHAIHGHDGRTEVVFAALGAGREGLRERQAGLRTAPLIGRPLRGSTVHLQHDQDIRSSLCGDGVSGAESWELDTLCPKCWGRAALGAGSTDEVRLEEAWAAAEAALPEGWRLTSLYLASTAPLWTAVAGNMDEEASDPLMAMEDGPTPAAALLALRAALTDKPSPEEPHG